MLKNSSVSATSLLAQKLSDAEVYIEPIAQTPLGIAVAAAYSPAVEMDAGFFERSAADTVYELARGTTLLEHNQPMSRHDRTVEDIRKVLATAVRGQHQLAKNTVIPMIRSVLEEVDAARKAATTAIGSVMAIVPDRYENLWNSPILESMVEKYRDVPANVNAVIANVHPLLSNEEIMELLKTGASRFDAEVQAWVTEIGPEFVVDTYRRFFAVNAPEHPAPEDSATTLSYVMSNSPVGRRRTLLCHLMARRLSQNVLEGINMELPDYREMIAGVVEITGRSINRAMEQRERDRKQRRLVTNWPMENAEYDTTNPENAIVSVNDDVYQLWLKDGGCPEILFGAHVLGERHLSYTELLERGEELVKAWARRLGLIRSGQKSDQYNTTITAIQRSMTRQINELPNDYLENGTRAPVHDRLRAALRDISGAHMEDLYPVIKRMVCRVVFPHTNAEQFISALDSIGADNPDMDPREVASLATLDLMVKWMCSQFNVQYGKIV